MRRLAILGLALAALPAEAAASTAAVERGQGVGPGRMVDASRLRVSAGPGEVNHVRIEFRATRLDAVVEDAGAPLQAGPGCVRETAQRVACRPSLPWGELHGDLGDGDDEATAAFVVGGDFDTWLRGTLAGGPGADRLTTSSERADLAGGDGDDVLVATGHAVGRLHGDAGNDVLRGSGFLEGGLGDDRLQGEGDAYASYLEATTSVRVDLGDPSPDGRPGEADALTGIDGVLGGSGDDRLTGNRGSNMLAGGGGDDVLSGLGGHDSLTGGGGADVLRGGAGVDGLDAGPGDDTLLPHRSLDLLRCGAGRDVVRAPELRAVLGRDCELYDAGAAPWWPIPVRLARAGSRALRMVTVCPQSCSGSVVLATPAGRVLGRARFGAGGPVTIPLAAAVRAGSKLRVTQVRITRRARSVARFTTRVPP